LARQVPQAGDQINRLLEPALRQSLGSVRIAQLSEAIGNAMHDVYIAAALLTVMVFALALGIPAGLSPTRQSRRVERAAKAAALARSGADD